MKGNLLLGNSMSCFNYKRFFLLLASFFLLLSANAQPKTALSFDGNDDRVDLPNILPTSYTKEAWINSSLGALSGSTNNIISGVVTAFWFPADQGFRLSAGQHGLPFTEVQDPTPLAANTWYHVAVTYDAATTTMSLYKNGVLVDQNPGVASVTETELHLGNYGGFAGTNFIGLMDEVKIWNVALTETQIRDRMCTKIAPTDPLYANLIAYYKADDGPGTTLADTKGTNDGALINGTAWTTSGAALGDASVYDYSGAGSTATITYSVTGESFTATNTSGSPDGIQVYRVDAVPDNTTGIAGLGGNNKYFGVFQIGGTSPTYTAVYDYGSNWSANESTLRLYKRTDNSAATWTDAGATKNVNANTLTATGQTTEYILGSVGNPLPVRFISFSVSKEKEGAQLVWITASEMNNKGFTILRSSDRISWKDLGFVEGNNSTSNERKYSFTDFNPVSGLNYYRLKQIDIDGRSALSEIRILNYISKGGTTIYPVPAANLINININNEALLNTEAKIFDVQGRIVKQFFIPQFQKNLSIQDLVKGVYMIQFADGSNYKIIKE